MDGEKRKTEMAMVGGRSNYKDMGGLTCGHQLHRKINPRLPRIESCWTGEVAEGRDHSQ